MFIDRFLIACELQKHPCKEIILVVSAKDIAKSDPLLK